MMRWEWNPWTIGASVLGGLGTLWLLFKGSSGGTSSPGGALGPCGDFTGDKKGIQNAINAALAKAAPSDVQPDTWMWARKTNWKPGPITADGKPGAMTCRAAEWLVVNGAGTPELVAFINSKTCGCAKKRAPCGIGGPAAPESVRTQIVAAGVKKGYPASDVTKALSRESGWKAQALNCQGADKHPVAGGLIQMLDSVARSNGWEGNIDQFAALTAEEQLPYVLKFISRMPPSTLHLPGDFGLALFMPAYVSKPNDFVIAEVGTPIWEQNPGLRTAGNGPVTAGKVRSTAA